MRKVYFSTHSNSGGSVTEYIQRPIDFFDIKAIKRFGAGTLKYP